MVNRGAKPNRRVEEALHHSPVTGVIDAILIGEIRRVGDGRGNEVAAAHRTAMEVSWQLQTIVARHAQKT
jgi:hypothetical protein